MNPSTASDLLELAQVETDPARRRALLAEAEVLALDSTTMRASDLLSIAACHVDASDVVAAHRCIELALRHAQGEIWTYRNAAKLWMAMAEPDLARQALEGCEAAFAQRETQGYQWRLLAEGWAGDLGESDDALRCLACATAAATTPDDHCSVATGLHNLAGDEEGARAALLRAEEAAAREHDPHDWWTIANTYAALGDAEGARASLERPTILADDLTAYLTLASAWNSQFPGEAEVKRCLMGGAGCAQDAHDWLQVAESTFDLSDDPAAVRDCLNHALQASTALSERRRVARGFRDFLGDRDTADTIAPVGLAPGDVATERVSIGEWDADAAALLDWLRPRVSPVILTAIADADYGMESEKNLKVLDEIVRTGLVPHPLEWNPLEVLHLTRWSEGASVDHTQRAFACALLCIEGAAGASECSEAEIIILLESCLELGPDAMTAVVGLMVALAEGTAYVDDDDEDSPFFWSAAILGLLLAAGAVDPTDPRLDSLAGLLLKGADLDGLMVEGMRPKVWRRLTDDLLARILAAQPGSTKLHALAGSLTESLS